MKIARWIFCMVLLTACSRGSNVDRNEAAKPMDDLTITREVAYAPGSRHGLDIYAPHALHQRLPVAVYFHGGGWRSGSKKEDAWVGTALARNGYLAVVADYGLYPEVRWPQFVEDCAVAVRWVHDHIADYGGDPTVLILIGHSAGGFNASSLALDRQWLARVGLEPGRDLKAVISLSSPYMGLPMSDRDERAIFSVGNGFTELMDHVDGRSPPLLFLVGDKDQIIDPHENDGLIAKIRKERGVVSVIHYPLLGHDDTKYALVDPVGRGKGIVMNDISHFLTAHGIKLSASTPRSGGALPVVPSVMNAADVEPASEITGCRVSGTGRSIPKSGNRRHRGIPAGYIPPNKVNGCR